MMAIGIAIFVYFMAFREQQFSCMERLWISISQQLCPSQDRRQHLSTRWSNRTRETSDNNVRGSGPSIPSTQTNTFSTPRHFHSTLNISLFLYWTVALCFICCFYLTIWNAVMCMPYNLWSAFDNLSCSWPCAVTWRRSWRRLQLGQRRIRFQSNNRREDMISV